VHVEAEQAERPPQVFTHVRIRHMVTGFGISADAVAQSIQLSEKKYCSVGAMIQKSAVLETAYELHEETTRWLKAGTADAVEEHVRS
jgi:putative redox protein